MPPEPDERFLSEFLPCEPDLRAYTSVLVSDPAKREDAFQAVALALWKAFSTYDPERAAFGAWARGVATNTIMNEHRKHRRFPVVLSPEAITAVQEAFDRSEHSATDRRAALAECLAALPEQGRKILNARYTEGHSCDAIASGQRTTTAAIHQSLSRLRRKLAMCINKRLAT